MNGASTHPTVALPRRLTSSPLADRVYRTLQDSMLDGEYPAGTHLVQEDIAAQLGVSRTPVREALIRLAQDEVIVSAGARGYMVVEPPPGGLEHVLEVRILLEPVAVVQALDSMSEKDFRRLEQINARIAELHAVPVAAGVEMIERNREFHMGLAERCENPLMLTILDECWARPRTRWIWKRNFDRGLDMANSAREHQAIIRAARSHDDQTLARLLALHIRGVQAESDAIDPVHR